MEIIRKEEKLLELRNFGERMRRKKVIEVRFLGILLKGVVDV